MSMMKDDGLDLPSHSLETQRAFPVFLCQISYTKQIFSIFTLPSIAE